MKIKGSIVMSRSTGDGSDSYHIYISDEDAGVQFVEIELTPQQFAAALTSQCTRCEIDVAGLENVGKVCETKTVVIPEDPPCAPVDFKTWLDQMRAERHMTDADGWYCREKRYNGHYQSKKGYTLHFYRFVPPEHRPKGA